MAHGFLAQQDLRSKGKSNIPYGKYYDTMHSGIKQWLKVLGTQNPRSKATQVADYAGQLAGSNPKGLLGGSSFANVGDGVQKSIGGGASGINPDIFGGGLAKNIVNFGAGRLSAEPSAANAIYDTTAQRVVDDESLFAKSASIAVGSNNEVVQAINVLTGVTRQLVQATQDQTAAQRAIAQIQHQQAEKLANRALARSEENQIEQGYDNSWDSAYDPLGGGRGGGRGGPGANAGGLIGTGMNLLGGARALKSIGRRGIGRMGTRALTRIGGRGLARQFAKKGSKTAANKIAKFGVRQGAKLGIKNAGKGALKKGLGKALGKKIPLVGLGLGAIFAAQRAMAGDWTGAALELASGASSTIPGLGTAASVGIDAALIGRDMGLTPFKEGGITSSPIAGVLSEDGQREGVFPLAGKEGKETFKMFGEGIVDAQIKRKSDLTRAFDGGNKGLLSWFFGDKDNGNGNNNGNGGGGNNGLIPNMVSGVKNLFNRFFGNNNKKEETSLLNTIAHAEGNPGYNTWFGHQNYGGDLSGKTIDQMHDLQGQFLKAGLGRFGNGQNSAAVGRYQFTHLKEHANRMGVDTSTQMFTPEFQDQLALFLAAEKGVTPELLRSQGLSDDVINKLSPVWASFPGNQYGQPTKDNNVLRGIYNNKSNTDLDMSSIFSPGTNANDLALASTSTSGGVNITNNYFSSGGEGGSGGSSGGGTTLAMPFGISSSDTGTDVFQEMGLRSLA